MMNRGVLDRQMFAGGGAVKSLRKLGRVANRTAQRINRLGQELVGDSENRGPINSIPEYPGMSGPINSIPEYPGMSGPGITGIGSFLGGGLGNMFNSGMAEMGSETPMMFAKGGAAFPDMSGDGKVTQKDILIAKGVLPKPMQMGGEPTMPPIPAEPASIASMPAQQQVDPAILEQMLAQAGEGIGDLENVESYEQMMNMMRGDEASIPERREELAELVGPQDAAQTPESVLALVQPIVQIASIDEGIGGLAQEQMTESVEGPMAGGIMSTMAPAPEPAPEMPPQAMGAGQTPPVNFNQGGLVRRGDNRPVQYYAPGGEVKPVVAEAGRLGELYEQKLPLYQGIIGDQSASLADQKRLTQAQMLFDLASTGLAFAAPMQGEVSGLSPAERLAMAAQQTQLPEKIGARAQQQLEREQAATAQEQQMKLAALGAAETGLASEVKAAQELQLSELEAAQKMAEIKTKDKLDTAREQALANLNISGDITLEMTKQANRVALEMVEQQNREAIEKLKASGRTADLIQANQLEQENIILRGNIELGRMEVANQYDLEQMDKAHEQATELNNTNNALKEKLANMDMDLRERRLKLEAIKAEIDRAQGERKLELQAEANQMQADLNNFEMEYKDKKLALEEAASQLTIFGSGTDARITTFLSDTERLVAYGAGTLTPDETLAVNQAIAYYNAPKTVWNDEKKTFVTVEGNPLSKELMAAIEMRSKNGLTIPPNIDFETAAGGEAAAAAEGKPIESTIMAGIADPMEAFGSDVALKNITNNLVEMLSLGYAGAPFTASADAIAATETLNTKTVQVFQQAAELRDSVKQLELLERLTATPASLFMGDDTASKKINSLLGLISEAKDVINSKLDDYPLDSKQYTDAQTSLQKLNQLEAGYMVFKNAYDSGKNTQKNIDSLRNIIQGNK